MTTYEHNRSQRIITLSEELLYAYAEGDVERVDKLWHQIHRMKADLTNNVVELIHKENRRMYQPTGIRAFEGKNVHLVLNAMFGGQANLRLVGTGTNPQSLTPDTAYVFRAFDDHGITVTLGESESAGVLYFPWEAIGAIWLAANQRQATKVA